MDDNKIKGNKKSIRKYSIKFGKSFSNSLKNIFKKNEPLTILSEFIYYDNNKKTIDDLKEVEGSKLSSKGASFKKEEESNFNSLNILEMEIRKLDIDIEDLQKKIEDKKKVYEREEKDKDEAINNQSLLFQEMTVRFQHILENTANKLQERVKTGN